MIRPVRALAGLAVLASVAGLVAYAPSGPVPAELAATAPAGRLALVPGTVLERAATKPLAGIRIALDPGHQLGNQHFPKKIRRPVPAGGFTKPCNTTGTATNAGYAEATFVFAVSRGVAQQLRDLGATVLLTRTRNAESLWGPCVDRRGAFGAKARAALEVSLHADGSNRSGARGFHVIAPTSRKPWTDDIAVDSLRLAKALRAGLDDGGVLRSTYLGSGTALVRRSDLGTLNLSDVPIAMVELGNMRNARDAALMTRASGRAAYAAAVVAGIRRYLGR